MSETVEVRILQLPLDIWARTDERMDGLMREFTLVAASEAQGGEAHVPRQLMALIEELQRDYAPLTANQEAQLSDAAGAGDDTIDLVYHVPAGVSEACARLDEALDDADAYCRAGEHLLSLAPEPDEVAFRRWYLEEFVRQIDGHPPRPWPQWAAEHPGGLGAAGPSSGHP
ncbi:MAG: hypothetical protein ACREOV_03680 [Candidatus Dormibacteraceae bacterium]